MYFIISCYHNRTAYRFSKWTCSLLCKGTENRIQFCTDSWVNWARGEAERRDLVWASQDLHIKGRPEIGTGRTRHARLSFCWDAEGTCRIIKHAEVEEGVCGAPSVNRLGLGEVNNPWQSWAQHGTGMGLARCVFTGITARGCLEELSWCKEFRREEFCEREQLYCIFTSIDLDFRSVFMYTHRVLYNYIIHGSISISIKLAFSCNIAWPWFSHGVPWKCSLWWWCKVLQASSASLLTLRFEKWEKL